MSLFYQFHNPGGERYPYNFWAISKKKDLDRHSLLASISGFDSNMIQMGFRRGFELEAVRDTANEFHLDFTREDLKINFSFYREGPVVAGKMGILRNIYFGRSQGAAGIYTPNVSKGNDWIPPSIRSQDQGNLHYWKADRVPTLEDESILKKAFSAWANS